MNYKDGFIATIGNTPLVALDRLTKHLGLSGRILAKLDYLDRVVPLSFSG